MRKHPSSTAIPGGHKLLITAGSPWAGNGRQQVNPPVYSFAVQRRFFLGSVIFSGESFLYSANKLPAPPQQKKHA